MSVYDPIVATVGPAMASISRKGDTATPSPIELVEVGEDMQQPGKPENKH